MERYSMFLRMKNQYCENDYTTKPNLQIQCDPYQITNGIFHRIKTKDFTICESESEVTQSCLTLCNPMDCSLPGSSVHGIFQARVLEWVAISFSRGSSWSRDWTQPSRIIYIISSEPPEKSLHNSYGNTKDPKWPKQSWERRMEWEESPFLTSDYTTKLQSSR